MSRKRRWQSRTQRASAPAPSMADTTASLRPKLSTVSIMPGMLGGGVGGWVIVVVRIP